MPDIDKHEVYEFNILNHVESDSQLNNRMAAHKLGVSVKLAHQILKRMVQKGLLHVSKVNARRYDYFLTPKGISEKTRLTVSFLDFSMHFYRDARRRSGRLCRDLIANNVQSVSFLGSGDLAEIVYLGVRETGLQLNAVFADDRKEFMGVPVQATTKIPGNTLEHPMIVCLYDAAKPKQQHYLPEGIPPLPNMYWLYSPEFDKRMQA
jgi:predicted transcriptional regulator